MPTSWRRFSIDRRAAAGRLLRGAAVALATLLATVLLAAAATAEAPGNAPPSGAVAGRAGALLADPAYQTELPGRRAGGSGSGTAGRRPGRQPVEADDAPSRRRGSAGVQTPSPGVLLGASFEVVMWVVLVGFLVAMLVWLTPRGTAGWRRREGSPATGAKEAEATAARTDPSPATPSAGEVEELARAGRYGEAVHLLLLRAIAELARRRPAGLADSLTSREVLRTVELPAAGRGAFAELVAAVERWWFGGAELVREEYERCADAYRTVTAEGGAG